MEEKVFKTMSKTGSFSVAIGIVTLVVGLVLGIGSIVIGGTLLKRKNELMF